jgi:outer membrane protein assembly factor BamB
MRPHPIPTAARWRWASRAVAAALGLFAALPLRASAGHPTGFDPAYRGGAAQRIHAAVNDPFALFFRSPLVRRGFFREVHRSFGRPAIVRRADCMVVATGDGQVLGLSLSDGHVLWTRPGDVAFEAAATLFDLGLGQQGVLLSSRQGNLLALDPRDGSLLWELFVDAEVRAAARQQGEVLFVSNVHNRVMAIDARRGTLLWSQGRSPPTGLTVEGHARPAVAGDRVYAAFSDGFLQAIDARHGEALWSRPLSLRGGPFVDADGDPQCVGNRLFACSYSDGVYAVDPEDGHTLWERPAPAPVSLVAFADLLIVGSADGILWGLRQTDGSLVWRLNASQGEGPISRLEVDGEHLLCTAGRAGLLVIDGRHGRPIQSSGVGEAILGDPVRDGPVVGAIGASGHVYAWRRD